MTSLLQISDPHFGTERPAVVTALRALALELAPDVVVLSGDITQRARRSQFRRARAFMDSLGVARLLVIPGNHDIPLFDLLTRIFDPYRELRRAFGADLEAELETSELLALCVNTTRAARHKDGEVSDAQIDRIANRLRRAGPRQLRIVIVHQPIGVARIQDEHDRLHGAEAAIRSWASAGADLILGGHIHLPYVLPLHEQMDDLPRRLWAIQAGTAVSARVRAEAENSVNLLRYAPGDLEDTAADVERWDWCPERGAFQRRSVQRLRLSR